jgi:hypothetical protein
VPILGTETNQSYVSSVPGPWNASVSSVPGPWNGWRVPTMPNQPTPYSGYISLVPPTSQHPPALSNITNVATFRDPDRSPPKKKSAAAAVAVPNRNPSSGDALLATTLAYASASNPNNGDDIYDGDCNVSAEQRMAVEAVESSVATGSC